MNLILITIFSLILKYFPIMITCMLKNNFYSDEIKCIYNSKKNHAIYEDAKKMEKMASENGKIYTESSIQIQLKDRRVVTLYDVIFDSSPYLVNTTYQKKER